jgi:hypothetical protein
MGECDKLSTKGFHAELAAAVRTIAQVSHVPPKSKAERWRSCFVIVFEQLPHSLLRLATRKSCMNKVG